MSAPTRTAVAADHVFDGSIVRRHSAVVIEDGRILAVAPREQLPSALAVDTLPEGAWLAPGFIDVQVNGGGDVLFNNDPTPEGIRTIAAAHRRSGTTSLLPTLITDTEETQERAVAAVQTLIGREPGVLGIHLEGPFLSPERPGVHDPALIRVPRESDLDRLTALRGGTTLVTLAPERAPAGFVARLTAKGVRVALGHSMATYVETRRALGQGLTGFTHLFNAMRPLASREPGPIAAALEAPDCWYGLIVDGEHVHPAMLQLALRGRGCPMLVTDAMAPVGGMRSDFQLYGEEIRVENGRCVRQDGTLAGAALDMASAVRNTVGLLQVGLPEALAMATSAPAGFIGADHLGRLSTGCRADMVALEPLRIRVLATWLAGNKEQLERVR